MKEENNINPSEYGALSLAYIGDCVYELRVREYLMGLGNMPARTLHKRAKEFVTASAQSLFVEELQQIFTEEEMATYKRGRNAKSLSVPKNAKLIDYKRATGLEALFGYLYLKKEFSRIDEFMDIILKKSI